MSKQFLCWSYAYLLVFLALGVINVGVLDPFEVIAQNPQPRPISEVRELPFESFANHSYNYRVGNRRDPFVPLRNSDSLDGSETTALSNSEKPDGVLTLLGIISGKRGYQALVKLPNGDRVVVGPGSHLENIPGTVKRITRDTVVIARSLDGKIDDHLLETFLLLSP